MSRVILLLPELDAAHLAEEGPVEGLLYRGDVIFTLVQIDLIYLPDIQIHRKIVDIRIAPSGKI